MKYNHKEAFCQMLYKCEECCALELLWNSRDGVTPFIINCTQCDGPMRHEAWNLDTCLPKFKPPVGSRVFKTMTMEEAISIAKKRIEVTNKLYETNEPVTEERINMVAKDLFHEGHAPIIVVVTENSCAQVGGA